MSEKMTDAEKAWIDSASYESLLIDPATVRDIRHGTSWGWLT